MYAVAVALLGAMVLNGQCKKQAENGLQSQSSESGKTGMDDWHGWLVWMTGMDDWHGWLAWMTGDYPRLLKVADLSYFYILFTDGLTDWQTYIGTC